VLFLFLYDTNSIQVTYANEQASMDAALLFITYGDLAPDKPSALKEVIMDSMDRPFVSGNLK
jgi:hypothetical protein